MSSDSEHSILRETSSKLYFGSVVYKEIKKSNTH